MKIDVFAHPRSWGRGVPNEALLVALVLGGCYDGDWGDPPPGAWARPERVVVPSREEAACESAALAHRPPSAVLDIRNVDCDPETEGYCFRLRPELRGVARAGDPLRALAEAAVALERSRATGRGDERARGFAFADLAVTGARSWAAFARTRPSVQDIPGDAGRSAKREAWTRAYEVAWALRGPPEVRAELRPRLGWVAVSPEDDPPPRPVNISTRFPQRDLEVEIPRFGVLRTRVVVASTRPVPGAPRPAAWTDALPEDPPLTLPAEGPVVLFVHGHASLAEEGAGMVAALVDEVRGRGEDLTVVAMDLPSNAYADRIDPAELGPEDDAALRFLERFLLAFVNSLSRRAPGLQDRISAVIGGSLGGNLVLRLAERAPNPAWVRKVVAWSPASVDVSWARARLLFAGPNDTFVDVVKHEAVRMTRDASEEPEDHDARRDYFVGGLLAVRTQADYWYRKGWQPCRSALVEEGLVQLAEVYDARFRRWHYRLAYEQLVFSHVDRDPSTGIRPIDQVEVPLLLVAGEADDEVPMQTFSFVARLAHHLVMPGATLFLRNTGHAMHSERPQLLAHEIARFLYETPSDGEVSELRE